MSFFSPVMPVKMWHRAWALQWSSGGMKQGKLRHGAGPRLLSQAPAGWLSGLAAGGQVASWPVGCTDGSLAGRVLCERAAQSAVLVATQPGGCLAAWSAGHWPDGKWLAGWPTSWSAAWKMARRVAGWPDGGLGGWLVGSLASGLAGWLGGQLTNRLVGSLAHQLASRLLG